MALDTPPCSATIFQWLAACRSGYCFRSDKEEKEKKIPLFQVGGGGGSGASSDISLFASQLINSIVGQRKPNRARRERGKKIETKMLGACVSAVCEGRHSFLLRRPLSKCVDSRLSLFPFHCSPTFFVRCCRFRIASSFLVEHSLDCVRGRLRSFVNASIVSSTFYDCEFFRFFLLSNKIN